MSHSAEKDAAYREQAEATIADLRARVSHYEARIAEQVEPEVSEDDLRAFIFEVVRRNESLPIRLLRSYRITPRALPPDDRYSIQCACGYAVEGLSADKAERWARQHSDDEHETRVIPPDKTEEEGLRHVGRGPRLASSTPPHSVRRD